MRDDVNPYKYYGNGRVKLRMAMGYLKPSSIGVNI